MDYERIRSRSIRVTLAAASAQVLGPNPRRKALYLSPSPGGQYSVAFGEPAILDSGITLLAALNPGLWVDKDQVGEDLTQAVHAIANGASAAGWLEVVAE